MAGSKFALAASTLLFASTAVASAQECSADVSESFIATIDNSTYFNTCAEGSTWNVSSVFDVLNFTDSEFLAFCNSSTCLEPLHELMGSVDCLITYQGSARNLSEEVDELHDQCHEVLEEAEGGHAHHSMAMSMSGMDMGGHSHTHSSGSTASGSSGASSAVLAAASIVSAAIAALFLA